MEDLVKYVVSNLVSDASLVKVETEKDGDLTIIKAYVPAAEIGKVIGKNGRIAQSIRTLVRSAGAKNVGEKYTVKILEIEG